MDIIPEKKVASIASQQHKHNRFYDCNEQIKTSDSKVNNNLRIEDYKNILEMRERELDKIYELNLRLTEVIQDLEHEKEYWQTLFYRNRFPLLSLRNFIYLWMAKGLRFTKRLLKNWLRRMSA